MASSFSKSSKSKCGDCQGLKKKIRKQITAFKELASINSKLSWKVLVSNLEDLISDDDDETETENGEEQENRVSPVNTERKMTRQNTRRSASQNSQSDLVSKNILPSVMKNDSDKLSSQELRKPNHRLSPNSLKEANKYIAVIHTGAHPMYKCLLCDKTLTALRNTRLHVRRVHFKERLSCKKCPKSDFYDYKQLRAHRLKCRGVKSSSVTPRKSRFGQSRRRRTRAELSTSSPVPTTDSNSVQRNPFSNLDNDNESPPLVSTSEQENGHSTPNDEEEEEDDDEVVIQIDPFDLLHSQSSCTEPDVPGEKEMELCMPQDYVMYSPYFYDASTSSESPHDLSVNRRTKREADNDTHTESKPGVNQKGVRATGAQVNSQFRSVSVAGSGQMSFECLICKTILKHRLSIIRHVREVHFRERYPCSHCGRDFYSASFRRKHESQCMKSQTLP